MKRENPQIDATLFFDFAKMSINNKNIYSTIVQYTRYNIFSPVPGKKIKDPSALFL